MSAGAQSQPFETDHRVAAPIGKPMVARDHRAQFMPAAFACDSSSIRLAGVMIN